MTSKNLSYQPYQQRLDSEPGRKAIQKVQRGFMEVIPNPARTRQIFIMIGLTISLMGNSCHERNNMSEHQAMNAAEKVSQEYIGTAEMLADGTIVLTLRAHDKASGGLGDAQLRYPPDHAEYKKILKHVGLLRPGESKPVKPFP